MRKISVRGLNLIWVFVLTVPVFFAGIFIFGATSELQFEILYIAVLFYISVALIHHYLDKTLKLEVVIEYLMVATLALVILKSLLP